jgi:hypothetical protein
LAASLSPDKAQFRQDLSDLNQHMSKESIEPELRYRLREYMHQTVHLRAASNKHRLLELLSPALAGEFALRMNERWLKTIWFLYDPTDGPGGEAPVLKAEHELLIDLAMAMEAAVFPHGEMAPIGFLYVITKGRALFGGRVLGLGQTWGTDNVLEKPELRHNFPAVALAYLWTYRISGETLREIVRKYPTTGAYIREHAIRLIRRRAIVKAAEELCRQEGVAFFGRPQYIYAQNDVGGPRRSSGRFSIVSRATSRVPEAGASPTYGTVPLIDAMRDTSACQGAAGASAPATSKTRRCSFADRFPPPQASVSAQPVELPTASSGQHEQRYAQLEAKMDAMQRSVDAQLGAIHESLQTLLRQQVTA